MGGIVVSADVVRIRLYAVFPTSILPAFFIRLLRQILNGTFLVRQLVVCGFFGVKL
jgi:hypothetical protein